MISSGRRPKRRPRAFIFGWADTKEEVEQIVNRVCYFRHYSPEQNGMPHIQARWDDQDIETALEVARAIFEVVEE